MPKPYPIIYLPDAKDQEKLVRALWRMGYQYRNAPTEREAGHAWAHDDDLCHRFPYVYLKPGSDISALIDLSHMAGHTLVNSIPHFLSYTRSLGAPGATQPHA